MNKKNENENEIIIEHYDNNTGGIFLGIGLLFIIPCALLLYFKTIEKKTKISLIISIIVGISLFIFGIVQFTKK